MNTSQMIEELSGERDRLSEAILVLERLAGVSGIKRRGRPPKNSALALVRVSDDDRAAAIKKAEGRGSRKWTPAQKAAQAEAQRKRWAKVKRAAKAAEKTKVAAKATKAVKKPKPVAKKATKKPVARKKPAKKKAIAKTTTLHKAVEENAPEVAA